MNRFHKPGQNPSLEPHWVTGRELDRARTKERAKSQYEGDAHDLKSLLGNYLTRSSLGTSLLPASPGFVAAWLKVAGSALGPRCTPVRWSNGTLWISVPDPGWKFELRWKLTEFAAGLRAEGYPVREIRMD
ncbi:MAG: Dna[CI] antecedent, DciA [Fibrobacterota bacterium]